uniref:TOG array regulator of axonemal microtubules protein 1-like n=1 Tax=Semicossyphus pulcher TaxID=241346 RepID=UPI0037E83F1F
MFSRYSTFTQKNCTAVNQTGSQFKQESPVGFTSESRIMDLQRAERAERAALTQRAEKLCAAGKARNDAVLERLDDGCADEYRLPSAKNKVMDVEEKLESSKLNSAPKPQPRPASSRIPVLVPLAPQPPKVPQTKKRGAGPGRILQPVKPVKDTGRKTESDRSLQTANDTKVKLLPLTQPAGSLNVCFQLLSSDDWQKKIVGLRKILALAQQHSEILKTKCHEVCLLLIEEVKNLRSVVACEAMNTLAGLYVHLQKAMDPEVESTGQTLLLKLAQTTSVFIHQQANHALDAMVENCSHSRVLSALLNKGLSHRCVAVRCSMARHLHQLADRMGASHILTAGRGITQRILTAVSKISVDASPEVRQHGQTMLLQLALHQDFLSLWKKTVPDKERFYLDKLLKKK